MKKTIVLLILICGSLPGFAQKTKVREARDFLADNNYKKAIPLTNEVVVNEETKNNADAWYLRGMAYLQQALDTTVHAPQAAAESYTSLMKALTIKPDYGVEINNGLYSVALLTFNQGIDFYTKKDFTSSYNQFMKVVAIYNAGGGRRFVDDKNFTDLVTSTKTNAAYAALSGKKDNEALALFTELKNTVSKNDPLVYQSIIEINQRQHNDAAELSNINAARSLFPNDPLFRNLEINYYIRSGKQDVLLGKLEAAVKVDPKNPELLFNLGNVYERAAFPKDESGLPMARPANFSDFFSKAETTYQNAVTAKPTDADYQYNFGVLYYESAAEITKQMNNIKGTTPEENKKYDGLLTERNAFFAKALPHFEKAYSLLDGRNSQLNADEKATYRNVMIGMREIYSRNNNKVKVDELKLKIGALSN